MWVKIDDQFFRNPKIIQAGRDARDLYLAALCFAAGSLTGGFVPAGALRRLAADAEIDDVAGAVTALLTAELWEESRGGYRIHDYLAYNPSAEQVKATRAANAQRQAKFRENKRQKAKAAASNGVTSRMTPAATNAETNELVTLLPSPSPSVVHSANEQHSAAGAAKPFDLLAALCDETGADAATLSDAVKGKQLAIAKRLLGDGMTPDDVRRMVRWLVAQRWAAESGIDLFVIERQRGKWEVAGRPEQPAKVTKAPYNSPRSGQAVF